MKSLYLDDTVEHDVYTVPLPILCWFTLIDCKIRYTQQPVLTFILISGASSGLGLETTRVLALRGVHVVMAVRNVESGRNVKDTILEEIPTAKIDVMELDLSSMASVRTFAADYNSSGLPLNILM